MAAPKGTKKLDTEGAIVEKPKQPKTGLEWRCLTCGKTGEPTSGAGMSLLTHECSGTREIRLVDKETGDIKANNVKEAISLGLVKKEKKASKEGEGEGEKDIYKTPQITSENFDMTILVTLPVQDFLRYKLMFAVGPDDKIRMAHFHPESPKMTLSEWLHKALDIMHEFYYEEDIGLISTAAEEAES